MTDQSGMAPESRQDAPGSPNGRSDDSQVKAQEVLPPEPFYGLWRGADPYTGEPVDVVARWCRDGQIDSGYEATRPVPLGHSRETPVLLVDAEGVRLLLVPKDGTPDYQRRIQMAMYARLTREGKHVPRRKRR